MEQLTVRGFGDELERLLNELARTEGISLNQAALRLMRKGAGIGDTKGGPAAVGDSLDGLIGSWSDTEAEEFLDAIADFEVLDAEMWR